MENLFLPKRKESPEVNKTYLTDGNQNLGGKG